MKNNKINNFQKIIPATTGSQYTDIHDLVQSNTESHLDMETVSINTLRKHDIFLTKLIIQIRLKCPIFSIFLT